MKDRSFFWPLTLIAAGVIWLLISMQVIPAANLWALTRIWPYVLILLGLGLILRSFWNFSGEVVSSLIVLGTMAAVVFAPRLGWAGGPHPDWGIGSGFGGAVAGSGRIVSSTRAVDGFDSISIRYPAQVVVRQGEAESVKIEADDNLLPQLATDVRDGTLVIENRERDWADLVNPSRHAQITITVTDLREIDFKSAGELRVEALETEALEVALSGAGEIELDELQVKSLDVALSGAGNIRAEGRAEELNLVISGMGSFEADGLETRIASVRISGAGSAEVRVKDELSAAVSGAGSINYYGSPRVTEIISGAGSVDQAGE
jgi:hypothetical protein